jgi:hypothetical protein
MKKLKINIKLFLLSLFVMSQFSCNEDILNVEPVNEFLSSNFFQTEDQVFSALVAAYDPVGWSMAYGQWISYIMYGEIRSDNANAGGDASDNDQPGWQELDDFRNTNTNTIVQPMYRRCYIGIFRATTVIEVDNPNLDAALVDQYKAEAKFLRAYYHFELFKNFGPIPVVQELLAPDQVDLSRSTMTEVFTAITEDLEAAIPLLPISVSSSETGRVTQGAALAMLGKAYLYWADMDGDDSAKFDKAAENLQKVVDFGIYDLLDDYQSLFGFNVKNTQESVFEVQHNPLYTSDWGWFEGIDGNGVVQLCGIRGLCGDHPDYQAGWGFMIPTAGLWNHFKSDDAYRKDVTLCDEAELQAEIEAAGGSCSPVIDQTQSNPIDYTGYFNEKYQNFKSYEGTNVNGGDPNLTKDGNTYIIRYADVLLMLAEALHRGSGADGTAMNYIDMVRERAAGPGDNTGNFRTAQDLMNDEGMSLLDVIWYERRAEFAMEGDRWHDLVRSGRANADLFAGDPLRSGNFEAKHLWIPISLEELSVATNLTEYPDANLFQ